MAPYVSGRVALADGGPLPQRVKIELVCQGRSQVQGQTDARGSFNIGLWLDRSEGDSDASIASTTGGRGVGGPLSGKSQVPGASVVSLIGCFLRASLTGYRSDTYDLSRVRVGDMRIDVGTLLLHVPAQTPEMLVSATDLAAPKDAKKALDKAREDISRLDFTGAEAELKKAVQLHPNYAEAWQEMGDLLVSRNRNPEAREAFLRAIASDKKYPKPYLSLALLSATERNWQESMDNAEALLELDASSYPQAYYYDAVASYNLGDREKAFERAQQAVKLDKKHVVPLAEELLGVLYLGKEDFKSAAEQFHNYIEHAPPGTNLDAAKKLEADAAAHAAQAVQK